MILDMLVVVVLTLWFSVVEPRVLVILRRGGILYDQRQPLRWAAI